MLLAENKLALEGNAYRPTGDLTALAVPETLTALIGSRLDALALADRALIQDAAAYGQSFTIAGLAAVSGADEGELEPRLARLVHAELLTMTVDARSPELGQYAFVQALIREVAYHTLSKAARKTRHLAAARYMESLGSDELAGALAGHYLAAFASAAPGAEAGALEAQARIALGAAAERAGALGAHEQAVKFLDQALSVTHDEAERAMLLERIGEHARAAGQADRAEQALRQALAMHQASGDRSAAARVSAALAFTLLDVHVSDTLVEEVEALAAGFADMAADPGVVALNGQRARALFLMRGDRESIVVADGVLEAAEHLDLAAVIADTLITKGSALFSLGRTHEGMGVLEAGVRLADQRGLFATALRGRINVNYFASGREPVVAMKVIREALRDARRLGQRGVIPNLVTNLAGTAMWTGESDLALAEVNAELAMDPDPAGRAWLLGGSALHHCLRGEPVDEAMAELEEDLLRVTDPQFVAFVGIVRGMRAFAAGDYRQARAEVREAVRVDQTRAPVALAWAGRYALFATDLRAATEDHDALAAVGRRGAADDARLREINAGIAALEGLTATAIDLYAQNLTVWNDLGMPYDAAITGLEMVTLLDPTEPRVRAAGVAARDLMVQLGAKPFLARLDAAMARTEPRKAAKAAALPTH
jgi:tetratricopeptide (TPR) repeat protein